MTSPESHEPHRGENPGLGKRRKSERTTAHDVTKKNVTSDNTTVVDPHRQALFVSDFAIVKGRAVPEFCPCEGCAKHTKDSKHYLPEGRATKRPAPRKTDCKETDV